VEDRHLISVDELRAAGALEVPAAWRKSLHVERDAAPSLFGDDDTDSEDQQSRRADADTDYSADKLP
jgi:hypothetical protein